MGCRTLTSLLALAFAIAAQSQPERTPPPLHAVQDAPVAAPRTEGLAVEVLSEQGQPVANALVGVLPGAWTPEQAAAIAQLDALHAGDANQRLAALLLCFCERYRCDDSGRAFVPATATHLAACSGSLAGELVLDAPAKEARIRLLAPRSVLVRAVGPDGKPVPNVLVSTSGVRAPQRTPARTDVRGECALPLQPRLLIESPAVSAFVLGADVRVRLASSTLPRTPVEL